jgi:ABC-type sugar transport system substrate-binding protein
MASKLSVFIGSSEEGKGIVEAIDAWLTQKADDELEVSPWTERTFALNEAYLESLTKAARSFDFAILVATPDDPAKVRDQEVLQARDNVIFELGLFMGRLGRARTFLVCSDAKTLRLPSDLSGVSVLRFRQDKVAEGDLSGALKPVCQKLLEAIRQCTDQDGGFFVLFPSLRNDPFYLDLLAGVACPSSGTRDVTFLVPHEAYSGQQFLERLDDLASKQRGFKGGLIAATLSGIEPEEIRKRIARFRIPIVLVDVNPYEGGPLPANVYYVGVDNAEGGKQAAAYICQSLAAVDRPRVLVLANRDQPKRHEGFLSALGEDVDTKVVYCEFAADAGRRATEHALRHHAAAAPFHAVFAVSDEVALGAVEAVSNSAAGAGIIVVGFDGFPSVKKLIDFKVSAFRNTVIQDAYRMGEQAMGLLRQAVDGKLAPGTKREQILGVSMYI